MFDLDSYTLHSCFQEVYTSNQNSLVICLKNHSPHSPPSFVKLSDLP